MATTPKATKDGKKDAVKVDTSILKNPRITEKAAKAQGHNAYLFDVAIGTTKSEIGKAFVKQYKHKPLKINTVTLKPKSHFERVFSLLVQRSRRHMCSCRRGRP